ncbi:Radial spoke head protein 9 [Entophlyctis sp. JEL0112]|nr:Radial spoke head protein 9 [Entophlyctis sp. JEL0112]
MSSLDISDIPQYFTLAGITLNAQERAVMATSLQVKAAAEKLENLRFWGKILAIQKDYMIAQANGANFFDRKFYYSTDLTTWLQLPEVTPEEMAIIEKITKRFTGDPGFEFSLGKTKSLAKSTLKIAYPGNTAATEGHEEPPSEGGDEKPKGQTVTEEKRLSGTIQLINYEVQIVPRGAYFRDGCLTLQTNPMFSGLTQSELGQLSNYLHFREGFNINKKTAAERAGKFDETIDIFDAISTDDPRGFLQIFHPNPLIYY